jgi:two-component system, NtrC family, response regulator AtoC
MTKILVVDDNKYIRFSLSSLLKKSGYYPLAVEDGVRALKEIKLRNPALVILDMKLPGMDGMSILEEIKKLDPDIPVIMLTAYGSMKTAMQAQKLGAYDFVNKPFDNDEIIRKINKALEGKD